MDYDVAALGLSAPPAQAVVTPYRPAVSVRNNGIHNAIASGYLRIYSAGLLIFETEVYSGTLAPGASGTADGVDYWTPPAAGTYIVNGYVTTPLDQVEPNNNLNPTTIDVKGGPVPPPPTVPLHAAQHEEGGTDPINVDGLPGVLADRQPAANHAAQHQAGQTDVLNVAGLAGVLGDPQTPIAHGNAHHTPDMATSDELDNHASSSSVHTSAINLANREISGIRNGVVKAVQLGDTSEVPDPDQDENRLALLRETTGNPATGRRWGFPWPADHAASHAPAGRDPITGTIPIGAIIVWNGLNPTPDGWQVEPVGPSLNIPYIYLRYAPV